MYRFEPFHRERLNDEQLRALQEELAVLKKNMTAPEVGANLHKTMQRRMSDIVDILSPSDLAIKRDDEKFNGHDYD